MNIFHEFKQFRWLLLTLGILLAGSGSRALAQKTLPYEYGFENNNLETEGWTLESTANSTGISNGDKNSGSYSFRFYYNSNPPQYLISPELSVPANAAGVNLSLYYKAQSSSYAETFQVGYSTTDNATASFTWDDEVTTNETTWKQYTLALPKDVKYVAVKYNSNDKYYLFVDDIQISCILNGPALKVFDGENVLTSGYSYGFGLAAEGATKSFTLKNPGTANAPISVSQTGQFGVELSSTTIAPNGSVTLDVTVPSASGSDVITISSTDASIDDFVINVSAEVRDADKLWCDFSAGLPMGWTNDGYAIAETGAGDGTTGGGYASNTSYGSDKLLYTPLVTIAEGEKIYLKVKGYGNTASWNKLTIRYSADGQNWTDAEQLNPAGNVWTGVEVSEIPAGNWYVGFYGSYVYFTDIYGGKESLAPVISLSQTSYDFGLLAEQTTSSEITITNTGKSALTGLVITSDNDNFTATPSATTIAANGGTVTFTVTMSASVQGTQSATFTIKSDNADDLTFTASGAVAKTGTQTVDFNDNELPAGWTKNGNTSFADGAAYFYYSTNTLTSPKLTLAADDFIAVKAKLAQSYGRLTIKGSSDGQTFTEIKKFDSETLSQDDYKTVIVSNIPEGVKYIQFDGYYCYVDEIGGLTYAPNLQVKQGDAVVTSPATYAFGECGAEASVTYNFANTGSGTLNITNVVVENAEGSNYTTNWTGTVAAPFDLVITQAYDAANAGEKSATVTVTTNDETFVINVSGTTLAGDTPKFAIYVGEEEQTTGAAFAYGVITEAATKQFTIKNDGTGALNVTQIALPEGYTIDATAPFTVAAGTSKTLTLTLAAAAKAVRADNIVISAEGQEDFTFAATAIVMPNATVTTFEALPDNWTNGGWTISNNEAVASGYGSKPYLTTPKLKVASDDFIVVTSKRYDNDSGDYIVVEYSSDNGETWTQLVKLMDELPTNASEYADLVVSGIPAGTNKLRFQGYYARIKQIAGLTFDDNDPRMGIYTDAACTAAATTTEAKDFGFVTEDAQAIYYIKNVGTGTMNLSLGENPAGFNVALDKAAVAAGEVAKLTIKMPVAQNAGFHEGKVVVTATELGTFTVKAFGVVVDPDKMNIDFTTDNIPTTWTANSWSKSENGYVEVGYSSSTLETGELTAEAGETLVVVAKQSYSSSYYTFGINYKKVGDEEWSTLLAAANIGTEWTTLHATIEEAGDYQIQFVGNYTQIKRVYGLAEPNEPLMDVYDGDVLAADAYDFGNVDNSADVTKSFVVKNNGKSKLTGLTATLSGEQAGHYQVTVEGLTDGNLPAGQSATITVTQLAANLGAHAATLTISATSEGIADKVIALSGNTRDAATMFVDFEDGNIPEAWTKNNWNVTTVSGNKVASAGFTASALLTAPLTVANGETLSFKAARQYSGYEPILRVRYTTDGGVNWTEYVDYAAQVASTDFTTVTLAAIPAGTAVVEIYGRYLYIDEICGYAATEAPMIALSEGTEAVANGATKDFGNLTENATATYTLTNTGNATLKTSFEVEGDLSVAPTSVELAAGESATIEVAMPFAAPYGEKNGKLTIKSEGWVGDMTLSYTATAVDPTALYVNFDAEGTWPDGWYHAADWTVGNSDTDYYARNWNTSKATDFITQKLTVAGENDALTFKAAAYSSYGTPQLAVSYSADRKNWTELALQPTEFTTDYQTYSVKGIPAGDWYLKFDGCFLKIDEIAGLHKVMGISRDVYVSASEIPVATAVPASDMTATLTANSLIADEAGVYAQLMVGPTAVATSEAQDLTKGTATSFTLTGQLPAAEGMYDAKLVVYYSDNTVAFETPATQIEVAHRRTLEVTGFALTSEAEMTADENNQVTATFAVTVKNTGSLAQTPVVKVVLGDKVVGTATAASPVDVDAEATINVTAQDMSAGEGGELSFTASAWIGEAEFTYATPVTINVTASAPKFELAVKGGDAVANGDNVEFGIICSDNATTKTYTITNSGNRKLELVSITAPEGYTATALNAQNKMVGVGANLDIDITLLAAQGKKSGDLVFTYKVDDNNNGTFTLHLNGRSVAASTWVETFDTEIPGTWQNGGWTWDEDKQCAYSTYTEGYELMTPRLQAKAGEELTFDVNFRYEGYSLTAQYSTDRENWTDIATYAESGEQSFVAPAVGNYYLKFSAGRYVELDNFVGFQLNLPEHDVVLKAQTQPYETALAVDEAYTFTVSVQELANKTEQAITAQLYVNGEAVEGASDTKDIAASDVTTFTITYQPQEVLTDAVAYVQLTVGNIVLQTADYTFSTSMTNVNLLENLTYDNTISGLRQVTLTRPFVKGWNTVVLPFAVEGSDLDLLPGAEIYEFTSYDNGVFSFTSAESIEAGKPYLVYLPEAIDEDLVFERVNLTTTVADVESNGAAFKGNYSNSFSLTGCYSVSEEGKVLNGDEEDNLWLKAFRAYFTVTDVPENLLIKVNGIATGITRILGVDEINAIGIYNISGQRVNNNAKGMLIIDGKKVFRK